ncbi:MAG: hypothetical protein ACFCUQ_07730 [Kiloniellales bacterium]
MLLVYGLGLAGAGVLLFLAGLRVFRRPQPPRWLQEGVSGDLLTVAVIGLVTIGVGLDVVFFASLSEQAFGLAETLSTAAVLALLVIGGRLLRRRSAPAAGQSMPGGGTVVPLAANDDSSPRPSGTPSGQPAGRGRRRKRAA